MWPYAGISVFPEKGTGILWHNLIRNGRADVYTKHASCTILQGNKWIANKWMGYNAQWNGTKCDLYPGKRFGPSKLRTSKTSNT